MGIKTKQQQQHHPNPLPHSQSRRGGSSAEPGRRSSLKVPPCRCEGCAQLSHSLSPSHCQSLWVCRRRTSAAPLSIITLCAALRCAALLARYQMIKSSAAWQIRDPFACPISLCLSPSCCVCVCTTAQRQRILQVQLTHISQKDIAISPLQLSLLCVLFCFAFLPLCLVWSARGSVSKVTPWHTHTMGGNKKNPTY